MENKMMNQDEKSTLFWDLAKPLMLSKNVEKGTMMGFPCLRTEKGKFFASLEKNSSDLIIKVPADRVKQLIDDGVALAFAPNGRTFKEWATIPIPERELWHDLIVEAFEFAEK
ncbi:MAG: hypothetical protein ACI85U_004023 [Candidatus Promineifilaceae bacterium]|jgi:hypothetical protein